MKVPLFEMSQALSAPSKCLFERINWIISWIPHIYWMQNDPIDFGQKWIISTKVIVVHRRSATQCHQTRLSAGKNFFHFFGKVAWKYVKKLALFQKFQNLQKLRTPRLYIFIVKVMLTLFHMWKNQFSIILYEEKWLNEKILVLKISRNWSRNYTWSSFEFIFQIESNYYFLKRDHLNFKD